MPLRTRAYFGIANRDIIREEVSSIRKVSTLQAHRSVSEQHPGDTSLERLRLEQK